MFLTRTYWQFFWNQCTSEHPAGTDVEDVQDIFAPPLLYPPRSESTGCIPVLLHSWACIQHMEKPTLLEVEFSKCVCVCVCVCVCACVCVCVCLLVSVGTSGGLRDKWYVRCSSLGFLTTEIMPTIPRTSRTSCQNLEGKKARLWQSGWPMGWIQPGPGAFLIHWTLSWYPDLNHMTSFLHEEGKRQRLAIS